MENNEANSKKNSLASAAFFLFKKDYRKTLAASFTFLMIEIMVIAVAFAFSYSLLISIPFVLIPCFFALQMSVSSYKGGAPLSSRVFFRFFGLYFNPAAPFYGVYRVCISLLKAIGVALLASFLVGGIYYYIAVSADSSFIDAINKFSSLLESGTNQEFMDFMTTNEPILMYQRVVLLSSYGFGLYEFIHSLSVNSFNPYVRMGLQGASSRLANSIFVGGLRQIRKSFYKDYYGALWLGILLLVGGYLTGVGVGFIWFSDFERLFVLGLAGSALFTFAYIPYLLNVIELLATRYEKGFVEYSINMAKQTLDRLKAEQNLSEKEIKDMEEQLQQAQDLQNEAKNSPNEEDKKDDPKDNKK